MPPTTSTEELPRPDWLPREALSVDANGAVTCRIGAGSWQIMVSAMNRGMREAEKVAASAKRTPARPKAAAPMQASAPTTAQAGATREADGAMTFRGQLVRANSAGESCVFTESGWLSVAAAERAGVSGEDLEWALFTAKQGTGHLAELHAKGPR